MTDWNKKLGLDDIDTPAESRYHTGESGTWWISYDDGKEQRDHLADAIRLIGRAVDDEGRNWRIIEWRDRYRFDDRDGSGSYICTHCGNGDGFSLVMHWLDCDYRTAAAAISDVLGIGEGKIPTPRRKPPTPPPARPTGRQPCEAMNCATPPATNGASSCPRSASRRKS